VSHFFCCLAVTFFLSAPLAATDFYDAGAVFLAGAAGLLALSTDLAVLPLVTAATAAAVLGLASIFFAPVVAATDLDLEAEGFF
jgi:hypothetical protein